MAAFAFLLDACFGRTAGLTYKHDEHTYGPACSRPMPMSTNSASIGVPHFGHGYPFSSVAMSPQQSTSSPQSKWMLVMAVVAFVNDVVTRASTSSRT